MRTLLLGLIISFQTMSDSSLQLIKVAESNDVWNGVTTSEDGRIFVCFPRIEGEAGMRIAELKNGAAVPFPDASWNGWKPGARTANRFVRTNSLRIGPDGNLWVVDTGTPKMGEKALIGAAELVAIDLHQNKVVRTIPLDAVTNENSFIDDLRISGETIYLTDAGSPGLVIMDKNTGKGRRVLQNTPATTDNIPMLAEGKVMKTPDGKEVLIHADQLEISPDGKYLFFQPASGPLYRIATAHLLNPKLSETELETKVVKWFDTPTTGGTAIDASGNIYISDVNHSAIIRITPKGKQETIIQDKRLLWGDALWIDKDGFLWIPVGQLNRLATFQNQVSKIELPLVIYKLAIGAKQFKS
jgi:sugar lactone lactonase YvrE